MKRVNYNREYTAAHEAGHAVIATVLGLPWSYVYIVDTPCDGTNPNCNGNCDLGRLVVGEFDKDDTRFADKIITVCMAGVAGSAFYHGKQIPRLTPRLIREDGLAGDYEHAMAGLKIFHGLVGRRAAAELDRRMHEAYALLQANRTLHQTITTMLIENSTVTFKSLASKQAAMGATA